MVHGQHIEPQIDAQGECPSDERVAAWIAGSLGPKECRGLDRHVADCADCRELVSALLRRTRRDTRRDRAGSRGGRRAGGDILLRPGCRLAGRYRIVRWLGRGGMGDVYEAEDLVLGEAVALKVARASAGERRALGELLKRETLAARRVSHDGVCRVHDVGVHSDGRRGSILFVTMELLEGETLWDRLRRTGPMTSDEALDVLAQLCAGLGAVHAAGLVHGDLKSANVMLTRRRDGSLRAVLMDFGLARPGSAPGELATERFAGSPFYMAPEQVRGEALGSAADVYALGIVLYEMMTGSWPFIGDTPMNTALRRLSEDPVSPRALRGDLDARWERTILACLERDPSARPAGPMDVLRSLVTGGAPTGALAGPTTECQYTWFPPVAGGGGWSVSCSTRE